MTQIDDFRLKGSRDPATGQAFFPPRVLSADGALRPLEVLDLPPVGVLHYYAPMVGVMYGLIDLDGGVRVQAPLSGDQHEIGAEYRLAGNDAEWWFARA